MADLQFNETKFPGTTLRGFEPQDAELVRSSFHVPGTSLNVVITLGLGQRMIVVRHLLHDATWTSVDRLKSFLASLDALKARGQQGTLRVPCGESVLQYDRCFFDGFKVDPERSFLPDFAGTLDLTKPPGRWFADGVAVFVQAQVVT